MKLSSLFHFTLLLPAICGFNYEAIAQKNIIGNNIKQRLETLLDQKEYFRLDTELKLFKDSLGEKDKLYYQCFIDNAFNRNEESVANVDKVLKLNSQAMPDSNKAALLLLQADSYFKQFQYAKAAHNDSIVLSLYTASLDRSLLNNTKNDLLIRNVLQNIPPQETIIHNEITLQWKKDRMGLINIPIMINNQTINSVFDTKANLSCITQTYASKLGIKTLGVSIEEGSGITGIRFSNDLGIADSLYIGDILLKNVVFLVMPDEKLEFGPFSIHMIIGYPVIEQLKEIQFYKDGRMIVPAIPTESNIHNLALDELNPVLYVKAGNDTLCFHLDLGAQNTDLYATYFEKYKEDIIKVGKKTTVKLGGAGGSKRKDIYLLPKLDISVDDKNLSLHKVNVFTEKLSPQERLYGNLGEDFINNFDGFILNFKFMYFKVQ